MCIVANVYSGDFIVLSGGQLLLFFLVGLIKYSLATNATLHFSETHPSCLL